MGEWGWTSYKKAFFRNVDGQELYVGRFQREVDGLCYEVTHVRFWARHPIAALREIAKSENPEAYWDEKIN